jgi:hypothetical protein
MVWNAEMAAKMEIPKNLSAWCARNSQGSIAIWNGHGTRGMVEIATKRGLKV